MCIGFDKNCFAGPGTECRIFPFGIQSAYEDNEPFKQLVPTFLYIWNG